MHEVAASRLSTLLPTVVSGMLESTSEGKTLIALPHDDRFFDVANRVIKVENGRLTHLEPHHG
ncbi:MAG: hypothetical protein EPN21_01240 [Methylococcaceae bacterium]|nr:MAG: hypothetical protein EPN21_01240 [Methylococcaceae bacterium]